MARTGDIVSGGVLAGLGAWIISEARGWEYLGPDGPGPGFFPMWYGIAMVALSLFLVGVTMLRPAAGERKPVNRGELARALATWAAFAGSVALLKTLGFLLSFALLTLFLVSVMYRRPIATALIVAVSSSVAFYLLFPLALNVSLPTGVLGF